MPNVLNIENPCELHILEKIKKLIIQNDYNDVYFVGGSVRDKILKQLTYDFDISCKTDIYTSFLIQLQTLFAGVGDPIHKSKSILLLDKILDPLTIQQAPSSGTQVNSLVLISNEHLFDQKIKYKIDLRVLTGDSVELDAFSRDFTINAIYYDIRQDKLVDLFNVI